MTLPHRPRWRLGAVSFLNSKPLLCGLEEDADISLHLAVPAELAAGLQSGQYDVALLPAIDYQRLGGLVLLPAGGIGSDGPTLTVRIFSHRPPAEIRTLACDPDSHTSIALARIILAERFGARPELVALDRPADAVLLIGDKVIARRPVGYAMEYDLGEQWKELTGLPFVFAIWTARDDVDLGDLPDRLERARRRGLAQVQQLVERFAPQCGWPEAVALDYLTRHLCFEIGPRQAQAIALFHGLARRYGLVDSPLRPLRWYPAPPG
jgi:chorismate dehydratase